MGLLGPEGGLHDRLEPLEQGVNLDRPPGLPRQFERLLADRAAGLGVLAFEGSGQRLTVLARQADAREAPAEEVADRVDVHDRSGMGPARSAGGSIMIGPARRSKGRIVGTSK